MKASIYGAQPPKGSGKPRYEVIAPANGEVVEVTCLDERILGVACHWVRDPESGKHRSRRCYADEASCPYCGNFRNLWLGFVAVWGHRLKNREILRVGAESAQGLIAFSERYGGLRGKRLEVTRVNDGTTSRLLFSKSMHAPVNPVPQPHDLAHTVCLILGCQSIPDYRYDAEEIASLEAPQ